MPLVLFMRSTSAPRKTSGEKSSGKSSVDGIEWDIVDTLRESTDGTSARLLAEADSSTYSQWDQPADPVRGLKQAIKAIQFEITVLAGKPTNRQRKGITFDIRHSDFVIQACPAAIHGMGGVGKTRAAIE